MAWDCGGSDVPILSKYAPAKQGTSRELPESQSCPRMAVIVIVPDEFAARRQVRRIITEDEPGVIGSLLFGAGIRRRSAREPIDAV